MKKFVKFLLGLTAVAAAVGGILYFLKNVLMKDYLDDTMTTILTMTIMMRTMTTATT